MARYQFWDKTSTIYTPSGATFTAADYIARNAWAGIPGVKCVVSAGPINGGVFMEFNQLRDAYIAQGMTIPDGSTDEQVLALIEAWETRTVEAPVSAEERIAAALEFQNVISLPDEVIE